MASLTYTFTGSVPSWPSQGNSAQNSKNMQLHSSTSNITQSLDHSMCLVADEGRRHCDSPGRLAGRSEARVSNKNLVSRRVVIIREKSERRFSTPACVPTRQHHHRLLSSALSHHLSTQETHREHSGFACTATAYDKSMKFPDKFSSNFLESRNTSFKPHPRLQQSE